MIDFSAPNWFDHYVSYRKEHPVWPDSLLSLAREVRHGVEERFPSLHHPFYLALQRSGLIYGFPVDYPFKNSDHAFILALPARRRAKLILLDLMLHARMLENGRPDAGSYPAAVEREARNIRAYYYGLQVYGGRQEPDLIEAVLLKRVRYRRRYLNFQKTGLNSQLFWDLYFFLEYTRSQEAAGFAPESFCPELLARKKAMKKLTLQFLAATIHADQSLSRQEKNLYRHFHRSSRLLSKSRYCCR